MEKLHLQQNQQLLSGLTLEFPTNELPWLK